jgi:diguanylate cyclase (GGDEF)-like protein/PAS domain S-box-containing protein
MITDARGKIQWVNPAFSEMSGYRADELIGQTPSILKSGQQTGNFYQLLWATIARGETWSSETTERAKGGNLYTVSQTITPIFNDKNEIAYYIAIHEDVTAQKLSQERIEHMAHYDDLTNLPNRALFYDRLQQAFTMARRSKGGLALLFLDLDGFKQVNDSLGHHIGDLLLIAVAERLRECVRESDTVARLGGDEFTVILKETHEHDSVAKVAEKIIEVISIPYELERKRVRVGVSIGIARYSEEAGSEDELVNEADQAMYAAKSAGKNTYRFGSAAPINPVVTQVD